jgi:hypothetical protein
MYRIVALSLLIILSGLHASAQTKQDTSLIRVLVLDALNGKPQPNVDVQYFCSPIGPGGLNSSTESATTGSDGLIGISSRCSSTEKLEISVLPRLPKEQCGTLEPVALHDVLTTGVIAKPDSAGNIWCPDKVSKKLKAQPGVVIMFVKKPTWWQSHIAG